MTSSSSPLSSVGSFHTAPSTEKPIPEDIRPQASQETQYRPARQLPRELKVQCGIYLNEELYCAGLALLTSLLTTGASRPNALAIPAFVPTAVQTEFIITLLVHPLNTTNSLPENNPEVASACISLLRSLLSTVGPVNGNLKEAFDFTSKGRSRRGRHGFEPDSTSSDSDDERGSMNNVLASKQSIRNRADDFWHGVGWAFNCSVKFTDRWRYWKVWLEYMLDVLDADWMERERQDHEAFISRKNEDQHAELEYEKLQGSIVVGYLSEAQGSSAAIRRIVKAAFADGGADMLKTYPPVFDNETRDKKRKRDEDIVDQSRGHDIHDVEDDTFNHSSPGEETLESSEETDEAEAERASLLGGLESIHLRQRVLGLLSRVATFLPSSFEPAKSIYRLYVDFLKPLPLPAFSLFISPSMQHCFLPEVLCSLDQMLLDSLVESSAYRPRTKNDEISQDIMEDRYLPFCANTTSSEDNTKVSVLVESLLRLFMVADCTVYHTPDLVKAVEKGIRARESNIMIDKRKKNTAARKRKVEADKLCLQASAERLRNLLAWVKCRKT